MPAALIGHTGFVGGNLCRAATFEDLYSSTNIESIAGREYDLLVCAGAPAEKWRANADPEADLRNLRRLMEALSGVRATKMVLISTVDIYDRPVAVDESATPDPAQCQPYGRHRYFLEQFVRERFPRSLVVRLPGLFGPGLKKNLVYDLLHSTGFESNVHPNSTFQFYDVARLWADLQLAMSGALSLLNMATEPMSAQEVARCFGRELSNTAAARVEYDMRTLSAASFGRTGPYLRSKAETLQELQAYVPGSLS